MNDILPLLTTIAATTLNMPTLETRRCGDDFREVAVWQVRLALQTAYLAGRADAERERTQPTIPEPDVTPPTTPTQEHSS